MLLNEIFSVIREAGDDEAEHADALRKTGFWGKKGAGCIIMARDTGRFLIAHRGTQVEQPGTWGTWGGAIDNSENPSDAVKREVHEETGYSGPITVEPLYVFSSGTFSYYNFLVTIDKEFEPSLTAMIDGSPENQGYQWCQFGQWPNPQHPGFKALMADGKSVGIMKGELAKIGTDQPADGEQTVTDDSPDPAKANGVAEGLGATFGSMFGKGKSREVKIGRSNRDGSVNIAVDGKGNYTVTKKVGLPSMRSQKYNDMYEIRDQNGKHIEEFANFDAVMAFLRTADY